MNLDLLYANIQDQDGGWGMAKGGGAEGECKKRKQGVSEGEMSGIRERRRKRGKEKKGGRERKYQGEEKGWKEEKGSQPRSKKETKRGWNNE